MKKIIIYVVSLMLILGCFFGFVGYKKAYAETINYTATISTENSLLPDYAITSIERFDYQVRCDIELIYDTDVNGRLELGWWGGESSYTSYYRDFWKISCSGFSVANDYFIGLNSFTASSLDAAENFSIWQYNDTSGTIACPTNSGKFSFTYVFIYEYSFSDNLDYLVDMEKDDNLINLFPKNSFVYDVFSGASPSSNVNINGFSSKKIYYNSSSTSNSVGYFSWTPNFNNISSVSSSTFSCIPQSFYFSIYRPTERINNSLVLYNYNNTVLATVSNLNYTLRKGDNYYTVNYIGDLPNSYYIVFNSIETANRVFDEYIDLNINVLVSNVSYEYFKDSFVFDSDYMKIPLGFDFNFTFYNEPLVASTGSYNFDFDKPDYVSMDFSLAPFYIPVLEAVENIFIFLVFYCPVISDILALLKLDLFIGGLVSILNYLLGLEIGQFLTSCIAFIIFFSILKSFMPIMMSAGSGAVQGVKDIYNDSQFAYNRKEKRKRKLQRKEQRKQEKYRTKVINSASKKRKK